MLDRIRALEEKKEGYEKILEKGEEAYHKITENSGKLVTCLNTFADDVDDRFLRRD
jgi:hypothetical protein